MPTAVFQASGKVNQGAPTPAAPCALRGFAVETNTDLDAPGSPGPQNPELGASAVCQAQATTLFANSLIPRYNWQLTSLPHFLDEED